MNGKCYNLVGSNKIRNIWNFHKEAVIEESRINSGTHPAPNQWVPRPPPRECKTAAAQR
jgi:hypothetical protein